MDHQFKFGDKVKHQTLGQALVVDTSIDTKVGVIFKDKTTVIYFDYGLPENSWSAEYLSLVSDWIEIDWDDESTLPSSEDEILIYNDGVIMITQESDFYMESYDGVCFATHWQPLPKIPEVKHD